MKSAIYARLSASDLIKLRHSSKVAQQLENKWADKLDLYLKHSVGKIVRSLTETGELPHLDIETILIEHSFDVMIESMKVAQKWNELDRRYDKTKLALPPVKIPSTLEKLMKLQDLWRRGKYKPKRQKAIAKKIQKAYLEKVKEVWKKHSEDFRMGDIATQQEIVQKIDKEAQTTTHRATSIVRTETTTYYSEARRDFYDDSQDVTHYLYLAVRDKGTSPWCIAGLTKGKRGRHGLVYKKGDPLLIAETPACHPGCRSEILPLSPLNKNHLILIQDEKLKRRNHECFPLLKDWKRAS